MRLMPILTSSQFYQLPDAPPPPKLPPPPLSLELLELPELLLQSLLLPEEDPLDQLPALPLRPGDGASTNSAMMKTMPASRNATPSDPAINQASNPTTPPVTLAPT